MPTRRPGQKAAVSSEEQQYFVQVPNEFFDLGLSPYELAAYAWMKRRFGAGKGGVFESVSNMAKAVGMSTRRFHTAIDRLMEANVIRSEGKTLTVKYIIHDKGAWKMPSSASGAEVTPSSSAPDAGHLLHEVQSTLHEVQKDSARGADKVDTTSRYQEVDKSKSMSFAESPATTPAAEIVPQAARASLTKNNPDQFLAIWNEHRGQLPAVQVLTQKRKRNLRSFLEEVPAGTDPVAVFTAAVLEVAGDPFWAERKYNLDNLLRPGRVIEKAEKHAAGPAVDQKVTQAVQRASSLAERIKARREHQP